MRVDHISLMPDGLRPDCAIHAAGEIKADSMLRFDLKLDIDTQVDVPVCLYHLGLARDAAGPGNLTDADVYSVLMETREILTDGLSPADAREFADEFPPALTFRDPDPMADLVDWLTRDWRPLAVVAGLVVAVVVLSLLLI